jgi:hypothetical protein
MDKHTRAAYLSLITLALAFASIAAPGVAGLISSLLGRGVARPIEQHANEKRLPPQQATSKSLRPRIDGDGVTILPVGTFSCCISKANYLKMSDLSVLY